MGARGSEGSKRGRGEQGKRERASYLVKLSLPDFLQDALVSGLD